MAPSLIDALIPMHLFEGPAPVRVDLVYANPVHARNIFAEALYRPGARLWLHEDLAKITLLAAYHLHAEQGWHLQLKDGLRTIEAQQKMIDSEISKDNPHWTAEGDQRLLSPPGLGAHPRGMAIDISVHDRHNKEVNMGTPFDFLTHDPANNPAARDYNNHPDEVIERRDIVERAFRRSAKDLKLPILALTSEWWDYRFPVDVFKDYEPLSDALLPGFMQMTGQPDNPVMDDDVEAMYEQRARTLLKDIAPHRPAIDTTEDDDEDL